MRAVIPDELLEERRRLGLDRRAERWDGVLHMVPPASSSHNDGWTPVSSLSAAVRLVDGRLQVRTDLGIEEV